MTLPESKLFFDEARREFHYLTSAGFIECETEESSLTAEIEFAGKHVVVSLALDRRDQCMDCYVTRVIDGKFARNDVPGGYWAHLHHFLAQRRRYRGGFREFREDLDPESWRDGVRTYSRALKILAPEVASDEERCLEPK